MSEDNEQPRPRVTTERLEFLEGSGITVTITEACLMASELLELRRKVAELSGTADDPLLQRLEADAQGYLARRQQEEHRPGLGYALADEAWSFARRMEDRRREVVERFRGLDSGEVQQ